MVTEPDREKSEFNMAVSYLNRLNYLFYVCNESSMTLDAYTWYHSLMALYRELSTEMKQSEHEQANAHAAKISPLIRSHLYNASQGSREMAGDLYHELHTFELMLRQVLKKSGLLTKIVDDAAKALQG